MRQQSCRWSTRAHSKIAPKREQSSRAPRVPAGEGGPYKNLAKAIVLEFVAGMRRRVKRPYKALTGERVGLVGVDAEVLDGVLDGGFADEAILR